MGKQNKALTEEVGLDGAKVLIGLGTLQMKVKTALAERDRRKSQEVMKHKKKEYTREIQQEVRK